MRAVGKIAPAHKPRRFRAVCAEAEEIAKVAPWDVSYIDPSDAIARRVADVAEETVLKGDDSSAPAHGTVLLTAARSETSETLAAYASMGFARHEIIDLPVG